MGDTIHDSALEPGGEGGRTKEIYGCYHSKSCDSEAELWLAMAMPQLIRTHNGLAVASTVADATASAVASSHAGKN